MFAGKARVPGFGFVLAVILAGACSSTSTNDGDSTSDGAAGAGGTGGITGGTGGTTGGTGAASGGGAAGATGGAAGADASADASTDASTDAGVDAGVDAKQDAVVLPCDPGFLTIPKPAESDVFDIYYGNPTGFTCITISVICPNASATSQSLPDVKGGACGGSLYCWGEKVTNCGVGTATATFKYKNGGADCSGPPDGSKTCIFNVVPGS